MVTDRVEIRPWPLKVIVRGDRTIAAFRWPLSIALVILVAMIGIAIAVRI